MTGYGRAQGHYKEKTITVEIRSLNGKTTDIRCKLPLSYREKELELRKLVTDKALRGKFDLSISTDDNGTQSDACINKNLFITYYNQLKQLEGEMGIPPTDYVQAILRIPNVVQAEGSEMEEEEYKVIKKLTLEAIEGLTKFRAVEGEATKEDLRERVQEIERFRSGIEEFEVPRLERLKQRLQKNVQDFTQNTNLDRNRMEQEILFYMEKMDINEEQSRLAQHCIYFIEELDKEGDLKGRSLSFIAQEIGREINTMGAKAQFTDIQKLVVNMKNELEKIKEQLANIV
ncbi:hypothetical protein GCM10007940_25610 [Portibacter lacus]|uniref:YicC family protein n=2 Tax=Portibacter lacus TaxID=1099794 RepID=A0AA37SSH7_9BACT|nr:hypothetical protein GCM10007940_25610 [Portibacter lacus]